MSGAGYLILYQTRWVIIYSTKLYFDCTESQVCQRRTYYLQAKDTGSLIFHNPGNLLRDCAEQAPGTTTMHYTPNDGDLIIWPGWIPHEVEENPASHERINFAFNINLTSRQLVNNTT